MAAIMRACSRDMEFPVFREVNKGTFTVHVHGLLRRIQARVEKFVHKTISKGMRNTQTD